MKFIVSLCLFLFIVDAALSKDKVSEQCTHWQEECNSCACSNDETEKSCVKMACKPTPTHANIEKCETGKSISEPNSHCTDSHSEPFCSNAPDCMKKGSICMWATMENCCCPDGCLMAGLFAGVGLCYGSTSKNGNLKIDILGSVNFTIANEQGKILYKAEEFVNIKQDVDFHFIDKPIFKETVIFYGSLDVTARMYNATYVHYDHSEQSFRFTIPKIN